MRVFFNSLISSIVDTISYSAIRKMSSTNTNLLSKRVLSIQSHVVHGYVGNKSATFPLQLLGYEVDAINSVQFSNHTGYQIFKGQVLNEKELDDVFNGLIANNLHSMYTHLLTGYVGNVDFLKKIAEIVKTLKQANPKLIYVCDPVMGDDDFMYVPKELLPVYRDEIVPLSDITTPNQSEMEWITEMKIQNEADVWKASDWFHKRGVKTVALSSTNLGEKTELLAYLSQIDSTGSTNRYKISIPKIEGIRLTGTGDLFASLFLAHNTNNPTNCGKALEYTIATLQAVIKRTWNHLPNEVKTQQRKAIPHERELKLIQSKTDIEEPKVELIAHKI